MKWFDTFVSNTIGGTGNQLFFRPRGDAPHTGRIYYKIFRGGKFRYSLLFSNIMDSTYRAETGSYANLVCDEWEILSLQVGVAHATEADIAGEVDAFVPLTFGGARQKRVMPGEFFTTDPVELEFRKGDYLCCQIEFRGGMVPCHEESVLPTFRLENGAWVPDRHIPVPGMIGCDRPVEARIGYFGDSITQGIGTPRNGYTHWCALVAEALGERYSHWNLGIGYARGQDAATGGAWFFKAKQLDAVVVAFGSNDIGRGRTIAQMKEDSAALVARLKAAGVRVFLLNVPPFNWKGEAYERWCAINEFLAAEVAPAADGFLDIAALLTEGASTARYGTHPNEEGCRVWAEALIPPMKRMMAEITEKKRKEVQP